jgi:cell division transport system ATP-binding protein
MIRLDNVTKVYEGGTIAANDVSLDIQKGEFVFLVGVSGSGKSTLIRLMLRDEPVTRGKIWVAGKDITTLPKWKIPYLRRSVGTVFQDYKLLPNKTVRENVAFALEVLGRPQSVIGPQVEQVLELVGLPDKADRYPRQLSGGEQQRVSVARSFVNRPPIMLCDEPTGNLDPKTSVGIMETLDRINRTGTTIVMATHDHAIVDAMKRRVVALENGRSSRRRDRRIRGHTGVSRVHFLLKEAMISLRRNNLIVAGAVLAVFISLTLALGALVVNEILRLNTLAWQEGVHVIAFLNDEGESGIPVGAHADLLTEVQTWEEVQHAFYWDKTKAWNEYQELFAGQEELLDIDPTILPASYASSSLRSSSLLGSVPSRAANRHGASGSHRCRVDRAAAEPVQRVERAGSRHGHRPRCRSSSSDRQHDQTRHICPS